MDPLPTDGHSGISFPSKLPLPMCVETMCGDLPGNNFSLNLGVFRWVDLGFNVIVQQDELQ